MRKILFVMYNALDVGGIQNVMINIVRALHKEYIFDALVLSDKEGYFDEEFLSYGGKIFKNSFSKNRKSILNRIQFYLRGNFIYKSVKKVIEENGPYSAIHCHNSDEAGLALRAAKKCGVPIRISHAHTAFDSKYNLLAKLYIPFLRKLIYKNATDLIACSKKAGVNLFADHKFDLIYNTVDEKFLHNEITFNPDNTSPVLLQVGMICENKNQLFSLHVLRFLKEIYADARLCFIGMPKDAEMARYCENVKYECENLGLSDNVTFLPADTDVKAEMQKSTYVIFPSLFEGLGIVPIEAQALGVKCFLSSTVPDDVDCGGCVFLDLNSGAQAWSEQISKQFEIDHGKREECDISRFLPDNIIEEYRKLYSRPV